MDLTKKKSFIAVAWFDGTKRAVGELLEVLGGWSAGSLSEKI